MERKLNLKKMVVNMVNSCHAFNQHNKPLRINDSWDDMLSDLPIPINIIQKFRKRAMIFHQQEEQTVEESSRSQEILLSELQKYDAAMEDLRKTKLDGMQKKDGIERRLDLMGTALDGYSKAIEEIQKLNDEVIFHYLIQIIGKRKAMQSEETGLEVGEPVPNPEIEETGHAAEQFPNPEIENIEVEVTELLPNSEIEETEVEVAESVSIPKIQETKVGVTVPLPNPQTEDKGLRVGAELCPIAQPQKGDLFSKVVSNAHLTRGVMYVPRSITKKVPREKVVTYFLCNGNKWRLEYIGNKSHPTFDNAGWRSFAIGMMLAVGDVCIFQLVEYSMNEIVFLVTIRPCSRKRPLRHRLGA